MGIDQVAKVREIVNDAVAKRLGKFRVVQIQNQNPKSKVSARLSELDNGRGADEHEKGNAVRGTEKIRQNQTVLEVKVPAGRFWTSRRGHVHS